MEKHQSRTSSTFGNGKLSSALGWFGLGLGAVEVLRPRWFSDQTGVNISERSLRLLGAREVLSGLAVLCPSSRVRRAGLWARVAGDAMDLGLLAKEYARPQSRENSRRLNLSAAAVLSISALDVACAVQHSRKATTTREPLQFKESIAVNKPAEELFAFWRKLENLPLVMSYLDSVTVLDRSRSQWRATVPGGKSLEWEAEITMESPNELLAWRSVDGSDVRHSGSVVFAALGGEHGTAVTVQMRVHSPTDTLLLGSLLEKVSQHKLRHDLRRFKQLMETGEILSTEGQPAGRSQGKTLLDHVATM